MLRVGGRVRGSLELVLGRVRFEDGVQVVVWIQLGRKGWRNRCLLVLFSRRGTRLSVL